MFRSFHRWLETAPVTDPVDRRNAPFLQLLLVAVGTVALLNTLLCLLAIGFFDWALPPGAGFALAGATLIGAASWASLWQIRQGRLRVAVHLFVAALLIGMTIGYSYISVRELVADPIPLLALVTVGLVLGHRSLWRALGLICLLCIAVAVSELVRTADDPAISPVGIAGTALAVMGSYLLITLLLDRTIAALRETLAESEQRRRELERVNAQLRQEMAERERAQERLIHAQKMEVVGRLASGVAHDFDNIINVISGYAKRREQLADRGTGALVEAMGGIETASRRALAISRKLLNFSRAPVSRPEAFDLGEALRELQPMVRQLFRAGVRIDVHAGDEALVVHMDRDQLELMVLNIAANARDALGPSGRFSIDCSRDTAGDAVLVRLRDDGSGIPASVLPHIFEPFYTTKPVGQGTGLGLSVVRDMVAAAGGHIGVQSREGEGTCFSIRLPLLAAVPEAAAVSGIQIAS
ncbi:two-component sensor histidine kinase [Luteimonas sp. XNQY3]|nr:ATP-binding protein [Luteimonas sp. XNQY3]MCD9004781.1 two-component sensor histidine kinase [Luteimonas sp. XNQY3]